MLEGTMESLAKGIENISISIHNKFFPQGDESTVSEDELLCADKAATPSESQAAISSLPSPMDVYKKTTPPPPPPPHGDKPKPPLKEPDPIEVRYKPDNSITYVYAGQAKSKIEEGEHKIISSSQQKPSGRK